MARRTLASAALIGLATFASAPVVAQTADGVGDDSGGSRAESAEEAAEDVLSLAGYQRKFYQVSARMWALGTPAFVLNGFFDEHTGQWRDGVHNFAYGLEFTTRIPDKYDFVVAVDWANLATPDGYWLEADDLIVDADWGENNLSLLSLDVAFHWLTNLDRQDTLQLYYGIGLGGDAIKISAIKLPKGVTPVIRDRDFTIATIAAPSALRSEEEEAGAAAPAGVPATAQKAPYADAAKAGDAKGGDKGGDKGGKKA